MALAEKNTDGLKPKPESIPMSHGSWTLPRKREEHGRPGRAETDPIARAMPMRDDNQCLHGRDAHAPLAFVSHTLSSHFRISENIFACLIRGSKILSLGHLCLLFDFPASQDI